MDRCIYCGSILPLDAQFCGQCGSVIIKARNTQGNLGGYPQANILADDKPTTISKPSYTTMGYRNDQDNTETRLYWSQGEMLQQTPNPDDEEDERRQQRQCAPRKADREVDDHQDQRGPLSVRCTRVDLAGDDPADGREDQPHALFSRNCCRVHGAQCSATAANAPEGLQRTPAFVQRTAANSPITLRRWFPAPPLRHPTAPRRSPWPLASSALAGPPSSSAGPRSQEWSPRFTACCSRRPS